MEETNNYKDYINVLSEALKNVGDYTLANRLAHRNKNALGFTKKQCKSCKLYDTDDCPRSKKFKHFDPKTTACEKYKKK